MEFKAEILQKSIQDNKGNKFWLMKITTKSFALIYAKLSKITDHSFVTTEAGRKYLP